VWFHQAEGEARFRWTLVRLVVAGKGQVHRVHLVILRVLLARVEHTRKYVFLFFLFLIEHTVQIKVKTAVYFSIIVLINITEEIQHCLLFGSVEFNDFVALDGLVELFSEHRGNIVVLMVIEWG